VVLLDWLHLEARRCGQLIAEQTEKLVFRLSRQEVEALARLVGPDGHNRSWYREWMARRGQEPEVQRRPRRRKKKSQRAAPTPGSCER